VKSEINMKIDDFFSEQRNEWSEFNKQVEELEKVEIRSFDFGNYEIKAQYNPARIVSSGAKLDAQSIAARNCFLCPENRPAVQREIQLNDSFILLVNPFPILKKHFTIPLIRHRNQEILPYLSDMLDIAQLLPQYTLLYNGAKAGASAPDHIHFQAIEKGQLPLETEYAKQERQLVTETPDGQMYELKNYGRRCLFIESSGKETVISLFQQIYVHLQTVLSTKEEPMMNLFVFYEEKSWRLFIFPRKTHRPSQFFAEGDDYKMISPGAIDMAGIFVLPRKEDFDSMTKEMIKDVFNQVSLV